MKHLMIISLITLSVIVLLYLFKDELFYKPESIVNTKINNSYSKEKSANEKNTENKVIQTIEKDTPEENKDINSYSKEASVKKEKVKNKKIQTNEKNTSQENTDIQQDEIVKTLETKGQVVEVSRKDKKIYGKIKIKDKVLDFEKKYDPDIYLLFEDAKKYNLSLTFIIQKKGDKFYIEEIK